MTFRLPYVTPAKRQFQQQSAPDQLHTDVNLYPNPIPFHQTEWPSVKPVKISAPDALHTDINLFTNPIPFNSRVGSTQFDIPSIVWVAPTNIALTTVVVTQAPFANVDWSKPLNIPGAPFPYYPNLVLGSVPTVNVDWSKPFNIPDSPFVNYPNIVLGVVYPPIVQDWSKTSSISSVQTPLYPNIAILNPTVVSNPFFSQDFSTSKNIPHWQPDQLYPNIALQPTVVQNPFIPNDFSKTTSIVSGVFANYPNIVLQPTVVQSPIVPIDWSKISSVFSVQTLLYPNIVLTSLAVQSPFFTKDFSRPFTPVPAKPDQQSVNINLFTNPIPFGPYDYPRIVATRFLPFDTNGYPNVVLPNSSTPFVSYDWSKQFDIRASVDPQYPNLIILQPVGSPFSQLDWSKAYTISPKATNQNDLPNLLLIQPSIPGNPLGINGWIDWSYVKGPVIIVPDQNNLPNIVLFNTTPIPPPPDATPSGKWRWLDGYNELAKPRNDITGDIKKAAAVLSKMGGHARAQSLTSTQRSNIATTAANARWNPKR